MNWKRKTNQHYITKSSLSKPTNACSTAYLCFSGTKWFLKILVSQLNPPCFWSEVKTFLSGQLGAVQFGGCTVCITGPRESGRYFLWKSMWLLGSHLTLMSVQNGTDLAEPLKCTDPSIDSHPGCGPCDKTPLSIIQRGEWELRVGNWQGAHVEKKFSNCN